MAKTKNIIVFTQWGYEEGLIQSYTLPYLRIIHKISPESKIYLITQEKSGLERNKEKLDLIKSTLEKENIFLVPEKYHRLSKLKYFTTALNFIKHLGLIWGNKISYIHTFCTPAGGYGYILSRFTGKKLVIDSYEPHSEYMRESGVWRENSFAYKIVSALEKKQAEKASFLIATTPTMVDFTEKRFNIRLKQYDVKPACVDLDKFVYSEEKARQTRKDLKIEDKIVCGYAGKFGEFYLKDEVFELFKEAFNYWGSKFHVLLLSDLQESELVQLSDKYSLDRRSFTLMKAPHNLVPVFLSASDFAISTYRPAPSKRYCTPIKNGEYWALGLPVVITKDISIDSDIIEENNIGYVLKELSANEYRNAVKKIDDLLSGDRNELRNKIRNIAIKQRSYYIAENIYEKIYG
jgi:glycosyltransferase involved in cell wall biosynthesis